ncbi:MAG: transaldolase [Caldilineaceae bacterium]|nr:transaldolase [Caldilineaceae bacterium]
MDRMQTLHQIGQSIWLDYIERGMVQSGELQRLVDAGVTGVTSNPTIFQQAISKSEAYRADLQQLAARGLAAKAIFDELAIADIGAAADVLHLVFDRAQQQDGHVSIEVAPDLADDTEATIAEARRLFATLNRPNIMIKVPATVPGVAAIRQLISDGINVNVTLIFSIERYAAVKEAYFQGLESRVAANQPVAHIASVASFFISRVDANIDDQLGKRSPQNGLDPQSLLGKAALANAKLAYAQFQAKFSGERWQKLAAAGAQVQRPLWASTSTKNPAYSDLLYVEPLIGPHTVNTMPMATLQAFWDHGTVANRIEEGVAAARQVFQQLAHLGISIDEVTSYLERDGVEKFAASYNALIKTIEQQSAQVAATP